MRLNLRTKAVILALGPLTLASQSAYSQMPGERHAPSLDSSRCVAIRGSYIAANSQISERLRREATFLESQMRNLRTALNRNNRLTYFRLNWPRAAYESAQPNAEQARMRETLQTEINQALDTTRVRSRIDAVLCPRGSELDNPNFQASDQLVFSADPQCRRPRATTTVPAEGIRRTYPAPLRNLEGPNHFPRACSFVPVEQQELQLWAHPESGNHYHVVCVELDVTNPDAERALRVTQHYVNNGLQPGESYQGIRNFATIRASMLNDREAQGCFPDRVDSDGADSGHQPSVDTDRAAPNSRRAPPSANSRQTPHPDGNALIPLE